MRDLPFATLWLLCFFPGPALAQSSVRSAVDARPAEATSTATSPSAGGTPSAPEPADERTRAEARDRFSSGLKLYEEGEFSLALIEFERAYSLIPDHRVLYNIGQVSIQLGRYSGAVRTLRQYLVDGADLVPEERRRSVANDLTMLANRTALLRVNVNVPEAEVLLSADVVASSPMTEPLLVDAGEHQLTVRKTGYLVQTQPLVLAGRDNVTLDITLVAEPKHLPTEKTIFVERRTLPDDVPTDRRGLYLALGWSATALLGAGWATTAYLGYDAARERDDAILAQATGNELDRLESRARRWYLAADLVGAATLLSTGGMLYYTLSSSGAPARRSGRPREPSPPSAVTRGRPYALTVTAGPRLLALSGQF